MHVTARLLSWLAIAAKKIDDWQSISPPGELPGAGLERPSAADPSPERTPKFSKWCLEVYVQLNAKNGADCMKICFLPYVQHCSQTQLATLFIVLCNTFHGCPHSQVVAAALRGNTTLCSVTYEFNN
jgi:hypothetical protein